VSQAVRPILGAYRAFRELDATMVEINRSSSPRTAGACTGREDELRRQREFRRPNVAELRDYAQEDPASGGRPDGLNYVALEGDIGCIINGAGLAMATWT